MQTPVSAPPRLTLFCDGWYGRREDAEECLAECVELGATALGIVESPFGSWGILYAAPRVLFEGHRLDARNALWAPLRPR
jgi:hypothetical protein